MEKIRLGVVGLGFRGSSLIQTILNNIPGVEVFAVCDLYEDRAEEQRVKIEEKTGKAPLAFTDYRRLVELKELDAVLVSVAWDAHADVAIAAMEAGKYVGMEVGGASSVQECWELVRTSERTGMPCMMLENCCYGKTEMTVFNMIKKGLFGELVHCEAGYEHDLRDEVSLGTELRHYRLRHYKNRNGDVYPTHGLGPIAKYLGVNRGNRMLTLTSMASKSAGLHDWIQRNKGSEFENADYNFAMGDVITTCIKCAHGETIVLTHDTTLPRPYSRANRVQGTKGIWCEDAQGVMFDTPFEKLYGGNHTYTKIDELYGEYCHPLWKNYEVVGGHGGMDFLVLSAFFEAVRNRTKTPIDVYDAAAWMVVSVLSEESVAMGSMPVAIPDFTNGKWMRREDPVRSKYCLDDIFEDLF